MIKKYISFILLISVLIMSLALASCSSQDPTAPNGMKTLTNDLVDYYLYVPSGWVEDISTRFISAYASDMDRSNVSMEAFGVDSDVTLDSFWDGYRADFEATFSDMEYSIEGETLLLDGVAAKKYEYTATVTGIAYKFMQVTAIKEGTVYIFTYTAEPGRYEDHLQAVETILSVFRFK